jgi:hypothetical protein
MYLYSQLATLETIRNAFHVLPNTLIVKALKCTNSRIDYTHPTLLIIHQPLQLQN